MENLFFSASVVHDGTCASASVRIILHAKCACVCFQYCCHAITQYYLFVLWILCMFFCCEIRVAVREKHLLI